MPLRPYALPLLVLVAALVLGWNLNGYRLLDPDEGRNAEVAREMAASDDYLVPHLDGLPYLDKPIVYFAAAAAAMELLGPTELAARLPAYLFTLLTIVLLVRFAARRWGPDAGWLAGLAFATMPLTLAYARTAIFDSTLTFCTTAAILSLFEERPVLGWAAMGLGAITKGPVALAMPLLAVVPYALAVGLPLRPLVPLRALAAFALVALPWFIAVSVRIPEFPRYVFIRETLERVTTLSFHRTGPPYYYLPIVLIGSFPWIVPALARFRAWRSTWAERGNVAAREPILLASWVIAPLVFFSLNQSKLPQYVLPLIPAVALAAARVLARDGIGAGWRAYGIVAPVLGVALISLTRWMPAQLELTPAEKAAIPPAALTLGVAVLASAALVALGALRRRPATGIVGYAIAVWAIPFASAPLMRAVGEDRSSAEIARAAASALDQAGGVGAVLGVAAYPPSLPFYLGRPIAVATETAEELTSNYIVDYQTRYRAVPGSPLLPGGYWREVLARCPVPTVFVTRAGARAARAALGARLPLLAEDTHYAAYGPCARPAPKARSG